ncbi:Phosphoribosylamine--glycine ligase [Desulfosporosinus sp. I2]|uniref:metallophosphoesterase n=1 Tax=Desulfosporosinus sp. I2 TaxID=1617025 RepID=UPI0005EEFF20|nr:metallophosphoesterase [Desulfosporosinus sp. I2]KJR44334.1 Phosphoribosylamine--glycine ligase [Desulfosporosinus sp. I2]
MTKISFIHLSDIHFVKTSGNPADIDQDLRNAILTDIEINAKTSLEKADGVLVSGDIAFSGNKKEYEKAKEFLEEITNIFRINKSSVYCVPGNHDVDQNVPKNSPAVYESQCKLDCIGSLDEIDRIFERKINDGCYNDLLFKTTQEYNEFASMFVCNTHADMVNWVHYFNLDNNMNLKIHGMNSCFISNVDDHKDQNDNRLMYIGQAQIPKREQNTVVMTLCHHPPDYWKFILDIQEKINRRADIQLYGHKHKQSILLTKDNITITSGATHPVRGDDWNPRYNWITIECLVINKKRVIKVVIYPRILDETRDRFIPDAEFCGYENFIEHILPIDEKREKDLSDKCLNETHNEIRKLGVEGQKVDGDEKNLRDLIYKFFDLSYIRQTEILVGLNLLDDDDRGKRYSNIISKIIDKAELHNQMRELWDEINK